MNKQNSVVLLNRLLSLKDSNPFMLVLDSLSQSSFYFVEEVAYQSSGNIIFLSFETINKPSYASEFIDCTSKSVDAIIKMVKTSISNTNTPNNKVLIIIDSLNYILSEELTTLITSLIAPNVYILATYHTNLPNYLNHNNYYPTAISLLSYISSSIFELEAIVDDSSIERLEEKISKLQFPIKSNLNQPRFKVTLTTRRKSGRSLIYKYIFNSVSHIHEVFQEETIDQEDEESMLKDLTTFNLSTSSKQKVAREQVELPYMQAQEALGSSGGAIVYEFEKDDDYDEEDPYEDPF